MLVATMVAAAAQRDHLPMRSTWIAAAAAAAAVMAAPLLPATAAQATPLPVDHQVPANGAPAPGYPRTPLLTPPVSPLQVPVPTPLPDGAGGATLRTYPYLSPWVHDAVPVPPRVVFDAAGQVALTVPTAGLPIAGPHRTTVTPTAGPHPNTVTPTAGPHPNTVTVNPQGHCLFIGRDVAVRVDPPALHQIPLPRIRIDTPLLHVSIDPQLWFASGPQHADK